jgi:hypothetical protein
MNPQFPVYIVSKNRWQKERRLTSQYLHKMGVPHFIVVEAEQADEYRKVVDSSATVLILDRKYQDEYDTCDDLGYTKSKGPGAARNFAWDHSISNGYAWHWVMDDNILEFYRLWHNIKTRALTGAIFKAMEDFVLRYENISMAGPNYEMFAPRKTKIPPFMLNTRIYSCNLIRNDVPYRWRGRYNEDTDLSLRMLKDGWCTVQFNAFLQNKITTQTIPGGNTEDFYSKEGTEPKSRMLVALHPDVARLTWRFGRCHHYVDYRPFQKNKLRRKPGLVIPKGINEYGMELIKCQPQG